MRVVVRYRWDILDTALDEARRYGQTLMIRMMPTTRETPCRSGIASRERGANKPGDRDREIWSPDADDRLYIKHWGALVRKAGERYDRHPYFIWTA
jgi:hypothetical protein